MLNRSHSEALRAIVEAMHGLPLVSLDTEGSRLLDHNLWARNFEHGWDSYARDPLLRCQRAGEVCGFLIEEFAELFFGPPPGRPYQSALIHAKVERWPTSAGTKIFRRLEAVHSRRRGRSSKGPKRREEQSGRTPGIDVLFVTALPTEYRAVLRRIDHYFRGSLPRASRGITEDKEDADALRGMLVDSTSFEGWVTGAMVEGDRVASVGAVCCRAVGPQAATRATGLMLRAFPARHVFVVGVGASLTESNQFDLGDVGYSWMVDDIHRQKAIAPTTQPVSGPPSWDRIEDEGLRKRLQGGLIFSSATLSLTGVLTDELVPVVQGLFDSAEDKASILTLADLSRRRTASLDFESKRVERPCDDRAVKAADWVADRAEWCKDIRQSKPQGNTNPRAIKVRALSGSMVVKDLGMREHLRARFPSRWLLEMEAGGSGEACAGECSPPMVIKAACDWATHAKEKSWQPYCADAAAAFARALALKLEGAPR